MIQAGDGYKYSELEGNYLLQQNGIFVRLIKIAFLIVLHMAYYLVKASLTNLTAILPPGTIVPELSDHKEDCDCPI